MLNVHNNLNDGLPTNDVAEFNKIKILSIKTLLHVHFDASS